MTHPNILERNIRDKIREHDKRIQEYEDQQDRRDRHHNRVTKILGHCPVKRQPESGFTIKLTITRN